MTAFFDDIPMISVDCLKLVQKSRGRGRKFSENFQRFPEMPEDFRRLPKTFEEDSNMFRSYTNELKNNLRDKLDISVT